MGASMGACCRTPEEPELVVDYGFRIKLGAVFPDFDCDTTAGKITFHEFLDQAPAWTMLFSHPKDFTPVCTTELGQCQRLVKEFRDLGVKMIGLSCDPVEEHREWSKDVLANEGLPGASLGFPLIADETRDIATSLGMLDPLERDAAGLPMPARALFLIGPDKTNRLTILYPATTGRNFAEVLRVVRSLFLTQDFSLATPANWEQGERLIVAPSVKTEDAEKRFTNLEVKALPSGKGYLRYVDCPEAPPKTVAALPAKEAAASYTSEFKIKLGAEFPDFQCESTKGSLNFHDFLAGDPSWTILFSHPKDFTPVCTTELGACHGMNGEFADVGVKLIGLSCDPVAEHHAWSKDVLAARGERGDSLSFPLIADEKREIATMLGMLDPLEHDAEGLPMPARALFVIDGQRRNRLTILFPATTSRNFAEVRRAVDSLLPTRDFSLATPANWKQGERLIVVPSVATEDAEEQFSNLETRELPSGRPHLRFVECPERYLLEAAAGA